MGRLSAAMIVLPACVMPNPLFHGDDAGAGSTTTFSEESATSRGGGVTASSGGSTSSTSGSPATTQQAGTGPGTSSSESSGSTGAAGRGHTFYVANDGDDGRSCEEARSEASPRQSIAAGIECLSSGDRLLLRGGTYSEPGIATSVTPIAIGIDADHPTTIAAYPDETAIVTPPWTGCRCAFRFDAGEVGEPDAFINIESIVFDGARDEAIHIRERAHHIVLRDNVIRSSGGAGIRIRPGAHHIEVSGGAVRGNGRIDEEAGIEHGGDDSTIEGISVHDNSAGGVWMYVSATLPEDDSVDGNVLRRCEIFRNGAVDQVLVDGVDNVVENNLIYEGEQNAIVIGYSSGAGNVVRHNTVYGHAGRALFVGAFAPETEAAVLNNIFFGNGGGELLVDELMITPPLLEGNVLEDPDFTDVAGLDFTLRADSRAVDYGVDLVDLSDDLAGQARPLGLGWDAGAFESH